MTGRQLLVSAEANDVFAILGEYLAPPPLLVIISGPSGVGKDSVVKRLLELEKDFYFVVTATNRAPRTGEVHGRDYQFVSTAEFERMIAEDELFEHAKVYHQYKGVPKTHARLALASGRDVLMRLDVQGAMTIKAKATNALTIFLVPPSLQVLIDRLLRRDSDSRFQLQQRLETAVSEMKRIREFDYVVVNNENQLDATVDQIRAIVTAEKCRGNRKPTSF